MRITGSQLRQIIREELLREVRITPDNLPEDVTFKLRISSAKNFIHVFARRGGLEIGQVTTSRVSDEASPCRDAYEVVSSGVKLKGLGPLLYDIAMEAASEFGGGLMSDRMSVSDDAQRVWSKYQNVRTDVERLQLDSQENELTPTYTDNCDVRISKSFVDDGWPDFPLSGVYRKPGMETIRRLVRMKKIQIDGMDI
jgi:hypothetical protein